MIETSQQRSSSTQAGGGSPSRRVSNGLVALGSAAVLVVYAAGYARTKAAADRFADDTALMRKHSAPSPVQASSQPQVDLHPSAIVAVAPHDASPASPGSGRHRPRVQLQSPRNVGSATTTPEPVMDSAPVAVEIPAAVPLPAPIVTPPAVQRAETPALERVAAQWKDGTYTGYGTSRHGDIEAAVVIEGGRITSAVITQCLTRYSCSVIGQLPGQVVKRQSADVDYVSGATQSSNAFYTAIAEALTKAK